MRRNKTDQTVDWSEDIPETDEVERGEKGGRTTTGETTQDKEWETDLTDDTDESM